MSKASSDASFGVSGGSGVWHEKILEDIVRAEDRRNFKTSIDFVPLTNQVADWWENAYDFCFVVDA